MPEHYPKKWARNEMVGPEVIDGESNERPLNSDPQASLS
jgi:hypothetical protein